MRAKACRRSTSMLKRDTMHRSSNRFSLIVLLFCSTLSLWAQSGQSGQSASQSSQHPAQSQQQQPVQDLTPPSDAEAERTAAPAPAPNQPTDTTKVPTQAQPSQNPSDPYKFIKDVEEVTLYATVVDPKNHL